MENTKVVDLTGVMKFDIPEAEIVPHINWFDPKKIAESSDTAIHVVVISDVPYIKPRNHMENVKVNYKAKPSILRQRLLYLDQCLIKLTGKPANRDRLVINNFPYTTIQQRNEILSLKVKQLSNRPVVIYWDPAAGFNKVSNM